MQYAGFWRRFGASLIDILILMPIGLFVLWGEAQSRLFQLYYVIPELLFGFWFHVYLVKRYGGTPGKLWLNIKIAKLDGSDIGYKESMLRYSVLFIFTLLTTSVVFTVDQATFLVRVDDHHCHIFWH